MYEYETENISTFFGTIESTQTVDSLDGQSVDKDSTFCVAAIFIMSMIVGLLIFSQLSRRWYA